MNDEKRAAHPDVPLVIDDGDESDPRW